MKSNWQQCLARHAFPPWRLIAPPDGGQHRWQMVRSPPSRPAGCTNQSVSCETYCCSSRVKDICWRKAGCYVSTCRLTWRQRNAEDIN